MSESILIDGARYLSAGDAAAASDLTRDNVAKLAREGKVPARRIGKNWYVESSGFHAFVRGQEASKLERRAMLAQERAVEYRAGSQHVAAAPRRLRSSVRDTLARAVATQSDALARGASVLGSMNGAADAAVRSVAHVPAHVASPIGEFVHKLVALSLAFMLVFGTYALVEPSYARFALQSMRDGVSSATKIAARGSDASVRAQTQFAAAADHPAATFARLVDSVPSAAARLARQFNAQVDQLVYQMMFPKEVTDSYAVVLRPVPTKPADPVAVASTTESEPIQTAPSPQTVVRNETTTVIQQPVVERVVERERVVTQGGITEEYLAARLQELDNSLSSRLYASTAANSTAIAQNYVVTSQTNRIDNLGDVDIANSRFTGGSISDSSVAATALSVSGDTTLTGATINGDLSISGSIGVTGTSSALTIANAEITNSTTTTAYVDSLTASTSTIENLTFTSASGSYATSTNFFSSIARLTDAVIGTLSATFATITGLDVTNSTTTNATTTNAFVASLTAATSSLEEFTFTNASGTSATTTNLFASTASSSRLFSTEARIGTLNLSGLALFENGFLSNASSTIGDGTQSGGLTISGGATTTGNQYVGGSLHVGGNATIIGNTTSDLLTINSAVNSHFIPNGNKIFDIGSPSFFWRNAYIDSLNVNNISAASTTIGGTASSNFTINSDNATADAEDISITFFRGTVVPNAVIAWDSTDKRFEFNQATYISNLSGSTTQPTLRLRGVANQTGNLFEIASSSGETLFTVGSTGSVSIAGSLTVAGELTSTLQASTTMFSSLGPAYFGSTATTTIDQAGNLVVAGTAGIGAATNDASAALQIDSTTKGFLPPRMTTAQKTAIGSAAAGLILYDSDLDKLNVYNGTAWKNVGSTEIGGEVTNGTQNSVLFIGDGDVLAQDNANFSFATSTNRLFVTQASSTRLSVSGTAYFGGTATSTFDATGFLTLPSGFLSLASSTIGDGTQSGGLTISGGATTTGNLLVQNASSPALLTVQNTAASGNVRLDLTNGESARWSLANLATASNQLRMQFNGSTIAIFDPSGNVGIGSTNPTSAFEVSSSTATTLLSVNSSSNVLTALGSGNVGIGTTTPSQKLSVNGAGLFAISNTKTADFSSALHVSRAGTTSLILDDTSQAADSRLWQLRNDSTKFSIASLTDAGSVSERLTIDRSGNVGIGTTSPDKRLVINDSGGDLVPTNVSGASGILLDNLGANKSHGIISRTNFTPSGDAAILFGTNDWKARSIDFYTSDTVASGALTHRMRIAWTGHVGIGTTSPSGRLHVYDGTGANVAVFDSENALGSYLTLAKSNTAFGYVGSGAALTNVGSTNDLALRSVGALYLGTNNSTSPTVTVTSNGNVGVGTTTPQAKLNIAANTNFSTNDHQAAAGVRIDDGTMDTTLLMGVSGGGDAAYLQSLQPLVSWTNRPLALQPLGGNIGIGTTTPGSRLAVSGGLSVGANYGAAAPTNGAIFEGNVGIGNTSAATPLWVQGPAGTANGRTAVTITDNTYATLRISFDNTNTIQYSGNEGAHKLSFGGKVADNQPFTPRFTINNATGNSYFDSGNVGIATTTPGSKLAVSGGVSIGANYGAAAPTNGLIVQGSVGVGTTAPFTQFVVSSSTPTRVGTAATSFGYAMQVQGRYAYVANHNGALQIVDLSRATAPTTISTLALTTDLPSIAVQGQYAYVTDRSGAKLHIVDISDPGKPELVNTVTTLAGPRWVYVSGRYAYITSSGNNPRTFEVYDVSNPSAAARVGSVSFTGADVDRVWVQGSYAYIFDKTNNTIKVIDVSNAAAPTVVGSASTGTSPNGIVVQDRYAYVLNYTSGTLQIFDVATSSTPTAVGSVSTIARGYTISVQGRYAYITDDLSSMQIIDVSDPTAPVAVNTITTAGTNRGIHVQGRYAYVVGATNGLQVYDLGGAYIQQGEFGGLEAGTLNLRSTLSASQGDFRGALTVGQSLSVNGSASILAATSTFGTTASIFNIATASSTTPIFNVLGNGRIGIGTSTPSDTLEINTATAARGLKIVNTDAGASGANLRLFQNSASPAAADVTGYVTFNANDSDGTENTYSQIRNVITNTTAGSIGGALAFATASGGLTERMRIDASGNVGIGTTSPMAKLAIESGATALNTVLSSSGNTTLQLSPLFSTGSYSQILFDNIANGAGVSSAIRGEYVTNGERNLEFYTTGTFSSTEKMRITGAGNVGIGTTTPAGKLDVYYSGSAYFGSSSGNNSIRLTSGVTTGLHSGTISGLWGSGALAFYTNTSPASGAAPENEALRILTSGSVGIGTTNPGNNKLAIQGDFDYANSGSAAQLRLQGATDASVGLSLGYDTTDDFGFIAAADSGVGYKNLVLNPVGGNVGVGTANPDARLEVVQVPGSSFLDLTPSTESATMDYGEIRFWGDKEKTSGRYAAIRGVNAGSVLTNELAFLTGSSGTVSEKLRITSAGNIGIGTTTPSALLHVATANAYTNPGLIIDTDNTNGFAFPALKVRSSNSGGVAATDADTRLVIDGSTGSIGIGTTTPSAFLHIVNNGTAQKGIIIDNDNDDVGDIPFRVRLATTPTTNITDADTKFIINNSGNVGIGKASPSTALDIAGTASSTGLQVNGNATITGSGSFANGTATINTGGQLNLTPTGLYRSMLLTGTANNGITFYDGTNYASIGLNSGKLIFGSTAFPANGVSGFDVNTKFHASDAGTWYGTGRLSSEVTSGAGYPAIHALGRGVAASTDQAISVTSGASYTTQQISLNFDGSAVFNEAGNDADFRIESDTSTHAFFLDGTNGNIGIGTSSPSRLLSVGNDGTNSAYFSGRVGVGNSTPLAQFDVRTTGTSAIDAHSSNSNIVFRGFNDAYSSSVAFMTLNANSSGVTIFDNAVQWQLRTAGNTSIVTNNVGQVGLGKAAASSFGTTDSVSVYSAVAASTTLTVYGATTQTAPLLRVQHASGAYGLQYTASSTLGIFKGTAGTAPTTITNKDYYLSLGGGEYGQDSYRLIGFGYGGGTDFSLNTYPRPAYLGFQEKDPTNTKLYGDLVFGTRASASAVTAAPTERMRITADGNVGIGTTTPGSKLSVSGDAYISGTLSAGTIVFSSLTANRLVATDGSGNFTSTITSANVAASVSNETGSGSLVFSASPTFSGTVNLGSSVVANLPYGAGNSYVCYTSTNDILSYYPDGTCTVSSGRFKNSIESLSASTSLATIMALRPVSFRYNADAGDGGVREQVGFIAEEVEQVDPRFVSYEEDRVTPLGVKYQEITSILTGAVQEQEQKFIAIAGGQWATTTPEAGEYRESFFSYLKTRLIAWFSDAANGITNFFADRVRTKEICVADESGAETCITKVQLDALIANAATASSGGAQGGAEEGSAPILEIQGNNPARIEIGDTYADLGAIITGPTEADTKLGIKTFLNGTLVDQIQIDTSEAGEHSIEYVATNDFGTSTSTRSVIVEDPTIEEEPVEDDTASSTPPVIEDSESATSTPPVEEAEEETPAVQEEVIETETSTSTATSTPAN